MLLSFKDFKMRFQRKQRRYWLRWIRLPLALRDTQICRKTLTMSGRLLLWMDFIAVSNWKLLQIS